MEAALFPPSHALLEGATDDGDVVIIIGTAAGARLSDAPDGKVAVVVELGTECLGVHTGEAGGDEGSNVLGFARFRLGESDPTDLVELVRQPNTSPESIGAARAVFENAGLVVAVCSDFAGRIVDRLIRPYYNEALRQLDPRSGECQGYGSDTETGDSAIRRVQSSFWSGRASPIISKSRRHCLKLTANRPTHRPADPAWQC